jgi:hypothetical protein
MVVFVYTGRTVRLWTAYTKNKDCNNLPNVINGENINWKFIKEIKCTDDDCLEEINNIGYYVYPKQTLEIGEEQVPNNEKSHKPLRYLSKKNKPE